MNTSELLEKLVTNEVVASVADGKILLKGLIETIQGALKNDGDFVMLFGLGKFSVTTRAAHNGRNPHTGKIIKVPTHKVVRFKIASNLKVQVK